MGHDCTASTKTSACECAFTVRTIPRDIVDRAQRVARAAHRDQPRALAQQLGQFVQPQRPGRRVELESSEPSLRRRARRAANGLTFAS
jgi:hypothetical protein